MVKKARTFFVQWSQWYDTHDDAGNLRNPDPIYFKSIQEAQDEQKWLTWRKAKLQSLLLKKDEKKEKGRKARKGKAISACHDDDFKQDNTPKPNHIHSLVMLQATMDVDKACEFFGVTRKDNCQAVKNKAQALKYELHITNKAIADGKHIYSEDALWGTNFDSREEMLNFYKRTVSRKSSKSENVKIDDEILTNLCGYYLEQGKLTLTKARSIFQDVYKEQNSTIFNKNKSTLETSFNSYLDAKAKKFRINGRRLTTVLISGNGGTGKTLLASALAYNSDYRHDWHEAAATGKNKTSDLADGYSGQDTGVFNEMDGDTESFRAFCSIFDPYNYSPVSSRNKNKQMLITKAFLTTSDNALEFITKCVFQRSTDDKMLAQNIISNYKSINEVLNLNSAFDAQAFDQCQNRNLMMNVARDHSFQVARRIACYIRISKQRFAYMPSNEILNQYDFTNLDDLQYMSKDLLMNYVKKVAVSVDDATTQDTAITLSFFDKYKRMFKECLTYFVKDVTDKKAMSKIAVSIDSLLNILDTREEEDVEKEIMLKALEMSKK